MEQRSKTRVVVSLVGTIGALSVYDVEYVFDPGDITRPNIRSVIVGTVPRGFHEIRVQTNGPLTTFFPLEILKAGSPQPIVKVKMDDGGNYHAVIEDYFVISEQGAIRLDFKSLFEAASKAIPSDMMMFQPTWRYDFDALVFHSETEKHDVTIGRKVACCEGRVEVPFRVEDGRVVAGEAKYYPDAGR